MTDTLEDLYEKIGQAVAEAISAEWQSAWVDIRIDEDYLALDCSFQLAGDDEPQAFFINTPDLELFEQLIGALKDEGITGWKSARFWLGDDGEFRLSFNYGED